ncbi:hypothetical protein CXF35_06355 [Corynebacterium bovis]|uniref:AIPR family protein n=2 Tax=Corynebacterium bovis TaxID=36808 RepID=UPI000F64DBBB|nr:AIPR family protein [Corynebacterium bovis]RRQ10616.1 hypothetical protein CXF34_04955 [Corynebacterium bovis]RRQ14079.1 hypothetical protein CXF35_06355 [Corynebacterium bovis]RRQ19143.1 hypothetical protein CXF33_03835 [Corynebacterium bovis]
MGALTVCTSFVNDVLLDAPSFDRESFEKQMSDMSDTSKRQSRMDVVIFQAKKASALASAVPQKIYNVVIDFLNTDNYNDNYENITPHRSEQLEAKFKLAMDSALEYGLNSKQITFSIYACGSVPGNFQGEAAGYVEKCKEAIQGYFHGSAVSFEYLGPDELLEIWNKQDDCSVKLTQRQSVELDGQYVMICGIVDYFDILCTEDGKLREHLFDGNVRGFLGDRIEVNANMMESLRNFDSDGVQFWWLNNGVTITCDQPPTKTGPQWQLEGVQIVNGLQTSNMIFEYLSPLRERLREDDQYRESINKNCLTVKVINSDDSQLLNRIIQSTKSQSEVKKVRLRATDEIQRKIERYFAQDPAHRLVYDRRRGNAANRGIPAERTWASASISCSIAAERRTCSAIYTDF